MDEIKYIVFRYGNSNSLPKLSENLFQLKQWKPSILQFIPPNKHAKYFFYWMFHFLRIFENNNYSAFLLYKQKELISSLLVVPTYYKWPFMGRNDLQITYVVTNPKYRGHGYAAELIDQALFALRTKKRNIWYITDTSNLPSIRLAEKVGFQQYATAKRSKYLKILKIDNFLNT